MDQRRQGQSGGQEAAIEVARAELQRAYLLLGWGNVEEALEACGRARELAPEHPLPPTIEATVLIAAGRLPEALRLLRRTCREHRDAVLPQVHFAEANLLMGRLERGFRELERAEALCEESGGEHAGLVALLRQSWEGLAPEQVPAPVVIAQVDGADLEAEGAG